MDRRLVIAGVALTIGLAAKPATAQEITFTSSTICKVGRGCDGFFIDTSVQSAVSDLEDYLRNRKESSGLPGGQVPGSIELFVPSPGEETALQCAPVCGHLGGDTEADRAPGPVVTPEPASLLLLASGLAGVGGAALRRRRRNS